MTKEHVCIKCHKRTLETVGTKVQGSVDDWLCFTCAHTREPEAPTSKPRTLEDAQRSSAFWKAETIAANEVISLLSSAMNSIAEGRFTESGAEEYAKSALNSVKKMRHAELQSPQSSSSDRLFRMVPTGNIGFDVTVEVDEKGEVPRRFIILRDSDPNGPTIFDVEDATALRNWLNTVLPSETKEQRTPKDYAIEHAEYMATAAESYIKAIDHEAQILSAEIEEYFEEDGDEVLAEEAWRKELSAAAEKKGDHHDALTNAIYEFRKRADRTSGAKETTAPQMTPEQTLEYAKAHDDPDLHNSTLARIIADRSQETDDWRNNLRGPDNDEGHS